MKGTPLKTAHWWVGFATVVVFLLTGLYLRWQFPEAYEANEVIRYQFRANHLYLLLAGLLHGVLGTYLSLHPQGWRRRLQILGSSLLLLAVPLLLWAFFTEPPQALPDRPRTTIALFLTLVGSLAHFLGRPRQQMKK